MEIDTNAMGQASSWWTWSAFSIVCTIVLTLVGRMVIKISALKKEEAMQVSDKTGRQAPGGDPKFCLNRCLSNDSKDSGFSGDEDHSARCKDMVRGKVQRMDSARNSAVIEKLRAGKTSNDSTMKKVLKGPSGLPFFGSLHLLGGEGGPFQAFTALSRKYGEIYALSLGSSKCVVVSSYRLLKEVLVTKGNHFGGRPDFLRFHELFGGDRNNSLALCDWSDLQRTRRSLARSYCSPRTGSAQQSDLGRAATAETSRLIEFLGTDEALKIRRGEEPLKPLLLAAVANMFTRYMCSSSFSYGDLDFRRTVRTFDEIFWEINQGYAVDFLPWLSPFYAGHMKRLRTWATDIRSFILERIVNERRSKLDLANGVPRDFTDALLLHLESPDTGLSWEHVIFELEDFLGGHSAIGNLAMLVFAYVVKNPEVQTRIQAECDATRGAVDLDDRTKMPYTEAVIWETLRVSSSPIVPHVATRDTDVDGYPIPKDTVIFINNYELNLGEAYWGSGARKFRPERFLVRSNESGAPWKLTRPAHFVPFSTGKRTCIGQRLVQGFTFATVVAILSRYRLSATENNADLDARTAPGSVAVPPDTFHLILTPRNDDHRTDSQVGFRSTP